MFYGFGSNYQTDHTSNSLNVSSFNTRNATDIDYMFMYASTKTEYAGNDFIVPSNSNINTVLFSSSVTCMSNCVYDRLTLKN